jgi:peptide/nickel transport system permease protein
VTAYLIRRLGTALVILIGISIFIFMLLRAVFPSPAIVVLGPKATPQAICIALLVLAGYSRYMRSSAMETLAQDYIKTARAKGLPERLVLLRHLLRNACLPMITLIGLSIPALLAGNLIAEFVFNYNGLGLLFYNSLSNEDYPVVIAYTLIGAVLTVAGNLIADIALTIADPRIRLS